MKNLNIDKKAIQEVINETSIKKQKGATFIEYALVVAGIAAIGAVLFGTGGTDTGTVGTAIDAKVTEAISGTAAE